MTFHDASQSRAITDLCKYTTNLGCHTHAKEVGVDQSSETDSTPHYINQVREWIESCDKLHRHVCVSEPIPQRPPEDVPLWLIDTHQQCIVRGLSAHRYLALSYVWPETRGPIDSVSPAPRTLLLDNASIEDFRCPGFLSNDGNVQRIPKVIRHAMEFSHVLGVRYLWVDRLCIAQNDAGDGGTLSQVAKMDKIYAGAYLTIIAAAPEEMYEKGSALEWPSFKSIRSTSGYRYRYIGRKPHDDEKSSDKSSGVTEMSEEEITEVMSARYAMLSRSRWATRGWTYQEQILCKRAVVFTESGFFWDCHCSVWDGVDLFPGQNFAGVALRSDMGQRFFTRWWPDFGFYIDLICPYNGREFSYPQDAMLGISGILGALKMSFPGGFIHGLPRLFLDHALLWQPFGTADRRVDRAENSSAFSSLPSWSWCGWQCFVDPWSLRSGLSYIYEPECQKRACSWRTRTLVEWHLSIGNQISEPVSEPRIFDQYTDAILATNVKVLEGWARQDVSNLALNTAFSDAGPIFSHAKDKSTHFKHPIPLEEDMSGQSLLTTPAYLTCSTTTTSLFPATVLKQVRSSSMLKRGLSKISVFEDKIFKRGPPDGKACPILVLQQPNGGFAGLLRLMSKENICESTLFELVAVSTGSANARDLRKSLEWKIFETGTDHYRDGNYGQTFNYKPEWISDKGKYALLFDIGMAFDKEAARAAPLEWEIDAALDEVEQRCNEKITESVARHPSLANKESFRLGEWFNARNDFLREQARDALKESLEPNPEMQQEKLVCEFYNVLWIERSEGISYRRACGWVPKYIWEAHATAPMEVKLG